MINFEKNVISQFTYTCLYVLDTDTIYWTVYKAKFNFDGISFSLILFLISKVNIILIVFA